MLLAGVGWPLVLAVIRAPAVRMYQGALLHTATSPQPLCCRGTADQCSDGVLYMCAVDLGSVYIGGVCAGGSLVHLLGSRLWTQPLGSAPICH